MAEGSKLKTTMIRFTSRASIKIRDNYYTVEATEERIVPEGAEDIDWEAEKQMLWDAVNDECDMQIDDIKDTFSKK